MDRQIIIHNTYIKRDRWRTHKKTQNAEKKQREKKIVIKFGTGPLKNQKVIHLHFISIVSRNVIIAISTLFHNIKQSECSLYL